MEFGEDGTSKGSIDYRTKKPTKTIHSEDFTFDTVMKDVEASKRAAGGEYWLTVDLEQQRVEDGLGFTALFPMDPYRREMLLRGLDEIGRTLLEEPRIAEYERRRVAGTAP